MARKFPRFSYPKDALNEVFKGKEQLFRKYSNMIAFPVSRFKHLKNLFSHKSFQYNESEYKLFINKKRYNYND
jgi:hypothetical protein